MHRCAHGRLSLYTREIIVANLYTDLEQEGNGKNAETLEGIEGCCSHVTH